METLVDSPGIFCMLLSTAVVSWGGGGELYVIVSEALCLFCIMGAVGLLGEVGIPWFFVCLRFWCGANGDTPEQLKCYY